MDVPRAVQKRWYQIAVAVEHIDSLKQQRLAILSRSEPVGGTSQGYMTIMKDRQKQVESIDSAIMAIKEQSGLVGSPDQQFTLYWGNYYWRKTEALKDPAVNVLPDGERLTSYNLLVNEMREQLKAAVRRIRER